MEHIINVSAVGDKMKQRPKGQRLYHFFLGVPSQLTKKEVSEIKKILKKEHQKTIQFIDSVKTA